jgi:hypothetical protein
VRTQVPGKQILDDGIESEDIKDQAVTDPKLSKTGVAPGAYTKVNVNDTGRVVSGESPNTLAGLGITDGLSRNDNDLSLVVASRNSSSPVASRVLTGETNQIKVTDNGGGKELKLSLQDNVKFPGNGAITLPHGTTAQQPDNAAAGTLRFNDTTNYIETFSNGKWVNLVNDLDPRLNPITTLTVQPNPGPGQFGSIKQAVDSITDAGQLKRYTVYVKAGRYNEDPITLKRYVAVVGESAASVFIVAKNPSADIITGANDAALTSVTLSGATGENKSAIRFDNAVENETTRSFTATDIRFGQNDRLVTVTSSGNSTTIFLFNPQFGGTMVYRQGLVVESQNNGQARILVRSGTTRGASAPYPTDFAFASGRGAEIFINATQIRTSLNTPSGNGIRVRDGALARLLSVSFRGFNNAIYAENAGVAPRILGYNVSLESNVTDLKLDHPSTTGTFLGTAAKNKVTSASTAISLFFLDPEDAGVNIAGKFNLGKNVNEITNVTNLIIDTAPMGLLSGGSVTRNGGTSIRISAGVGYLRNADNLVKRIEFTGADLQLAPGSSPYIYINNAGSVMTADTEPDHASNIVLARALVGADSVLQVGDQALHIDLINNKIDSYLRQTIGGVFVSGSIVTESSTVNRGLNVTAGKYYYGTLSRTPGAFNNITFLDGYKTGNSVTIVPRTQVPNNTLLIDGGYKPMTHLYYAKHALYETGSGTDVLFPLAHAQVEYATFAEALAAPIPTPVINPDGTPRIAAIIVQEGNDKIVSILDIRPRHFQGGGSAVGSSGTNDHGDLLGLADDDHTQYLLASGVRALVGNLDLGNNNIVNAKLINNIDVAAHASRHTPNGADPLPTAPAVSLNASSTNTTGISNSFARADHTHSLSGLQPLSGELTALASFTSTGIPVRTGTNTWAIRSIIGNNIKVINGNGVDGNITISPDTVGVAGTYQSVTTDQFGRVTAGTNTVPWSVITNTPTTLNGYGITDAQPLNSDLTALTNVTTTGIYIKTGAGTAVTRTLIQPAAGINIANPDGISGNIAFTLSNDLLGLENLTGTGIPVRTGNDSWAVRTFVAPSAGITITNPAGTAGNITLALANDLLGLENLATNGYAVRTANNTWATRSITSTTLTVTFGDGVGGNTDIGLIPIITAGNFRSVAVDQYGRVTSGTNPTTLAGYGITDAINVNQLGAKNGVATLDSNGQLLTSQVPAIAITDTFVVNSESQQTSLVAEVGDVAVRTDLKKSFILSALPASNFANWQELLTPTDLVTSVNGQTGNVVVPAGSVTSVAAQAPAAGLVISGSPITSSGTLSFSLANDLAALESLSGTGFAVRTNSDTWANRQLVQGAGITITNPDAVTGNPNISLTAVGTAGTYKSITTDQYGRVTAGSNPTTLAGFGITDAQGLNSNLTALSNTTQTGIYVVTGTGTSAARTLTPGTGISITNANGVSGNPTINNTGVTSVGLSLPSIFSVSNTPVTTTGTLTATLNNQGSSAILAAPIGGGTPAFRTLGLGELSNVVLTSPSPYQVLAYSGTNWVNTSVNTGAISGILNAWTQIAGTNRYYQDFTHNLATANLVINLYDTADNSVVTADSVVLTSANVVRVTVIGNSRNIRIVVLANGAGLVAGGSTPSSIIVSKDGVTVNNNVTRLNVQGQAVSVTDSGSGVATLTVGSRFTFFAGSLDSPTSADWAINALAPTVTDPTFTSLTNRQFSSTVEQGVGFLLSVPPGTTNITFKFRGRPQAVPTAASVAAFRLYNRLLPNNAAVAAWSTAREIGEIAIPTNANFQYATFTIPLANLTMVADRLYQVELTRRVSGTTGANLNANFLLSEVTVELS